MARSSAYVVSLVSTRHILFFGLLAIIVFPFNASALNFVAGSKCESVCSDEVAGTIHSTVRCLDDQYNDAPASYLKDCITCQLNSTAVDPTTNFTDVEWGLFNLRYALANCMFAYPEARVSISSPCQVTCAPLQSAVIFGIANSTNTTNFDPDLGFCKGGQFDDTSINNCAFCYSFIPQQLILGNFLQALHIACHSNPAEGKPFYPDGIAIFNQSIIAGPTGAPASKPTSTGLTGTKLILVIALPLVCGLVILVGTCFCCWQFTRKRRARMSATGRMSKFHDGQILDYTPVTPRTSPPQPYAWSEPPREMQTVSVMPKTADSPMMPAPIPRGTPGSTQERWAQHAHDESKTPLTSPDRSSYVRGDDSGAVGEVKDPNLHDQYLGGDTRFAAPAGTFRAQDGFVKEYVTGGMKQ